MRRFLGGWIRAMIVLIGVLLFVGTLFMNIWIPVWFYSHGHVVAAAVASFLDVSLAIGVIGYVFPADGCD